MNVFDFVNSINDSKKNLIAEDKNNEKEYVPFIVNKSLSYFYDTVLFSNEMNRYHHLSKKMQYEFYLNAISKKKRFSKWHKADKKEDVDFIMKEYNYSRKRAYEVLDLLSEKSIKELKEGYSVGGR